MTGAQFITVLMLAGAASAQSPKEAFDLNEKGLAAAFHQQHADAEQLYVQAVAMWRHLGPGFEPHLATSLSNLAQSLCAQGRRPEAAKLFQESLALFKRSMGPKDSRTLSTMNLAAAVEVMLGNTDAGEAMFLEALPIERELFPADVMLARTLEGLASVKLARAEYDEALPLAEEGLNIVLKAVSDDNIETALAYGNVAEIHRAAGRPERALPLFRKSRAIYEKYLGVWNARPASILGQEGLILLGEGKYGMAEKNLQRSLDIVVKACPDCILERIVAQVNLGVLRVRQKKYAAADSLFSEALELQEKYYAHPGPDIAATMRALAAVKQKQRRFDDAARLETRANLIMGYR